MQRKLQSSKPSRIRNGQATFDITPSLDDIWHSFPQGESVNILLNFREFLQASCEHSVQIVTAHRRYFLLASDARFA